MARLLLYVGSATLTALSHTHAGDFFALKAMRKGRIRELKMSASVSVEKELLFRHHCPFLVRGYFAMRSMRHIYFVLE